MSGLTKQRHRAREKAFEVVSIVTNIPVRRILKDIRQIGKGIQAVLFRGFDDAVHNRAGPGSPWRVGEQKVFAANDERFDAALGPVVADLQPAVR